MHRPAFAALFVCGFLAVGPVQAQAIPRFAAELSLGGGPRPARSGEVWYNGDSRENYLRIGTTVRLGSPGRIRPVVVADYSKAVRGDQLSLCGLAPNGTCYQYFTGTDGFSAGVGVRALPVSRVALGGSIGVARYHERGRLVDADLAIGITRRIHLLAHWRRISWPDAADGSLWFQPLTFGVRTQW